MRGAPWPELVGLQGSERPSMLEESGDDSETDRWTNTENAVRSPYAQGLGSKARSKAEEVLDFRSGKWTYRPFL